MPSKTLHRRVTSTLLFLFPVEKLAIVDRTQGEQQRLIKSHLERASSSTDALNTDEGKQMTKTLFKHALQLQETASLPPASPQMTPSPPIFLALTSLVMSQSVTDRSSVCRTLTEADVTIQESMGDVSLTLSLKTFIERPSYIEQFAFEHGKDDSPKASQSRVATPNKTLTASGSFLSVKALILCQPCERTFCLKEDMKDVLKELNVQRP